MKETVKKSKENQKKKKVVKKNMTKNQVNIIQSNTMTSYKKKILFCHHGLRLNTQKKKK